MKKKEIKLKKIVIDIKGKEISLTLKEVKELYAELGQITEKEYSQFTYYPTIPTITTGDMPWVNPISYTTTDSSN